MDEKRHYFRLGVFVVAAAVLVFIGLLVLAGPGFFQKKVTVETYFSESVSGLEVGSPVKFRGVPIGRVSQILLSSRAYPGTETLEGARGALVVVRAELVGADLDAAKDNLDIMPCRTSASRSAMPAASSAASRSSQVMRPWAKSSRKRASGR